MTLETISDHNYIKTMDDNSDHNADTSHDSDNEDHVEEIDDHDSDDDSSGEPEALIELPSELSDYHPTWKKSRKTFLDIYVLSKKTKDLLILSEEIENLDTDDGGYKGMENIMTQYKQKSINMLSMALNLPHVVVDKIFTHIVDSYNYNLYNIGPENVQRELEEHSQGAGALRLSS